MVNFELVLEMAELIAQGNIPKSMNFNEFCIKFYLETIRRIFKSSIFSSAVCSDKYLLKYSSIYSTYLSMESYLTNIHW